VEWPGAAFDEHSPGTSVWRAVDIPIDGCDAVLLGHPVANESGLEWLETLAARPGCPPIVVFADPSDEFLAVDALKVGAASYFPKRDLRHGRLIEVLRGALESRSAETPADSSRAAGRADALDLSTGGGTRRYRFIKRLHATDLSTVYLAEDDASGARVVCKVV